MRGLGTLLNVAAIAAGASVGSLLGDRLPQRLRDTLVAALGLFTLTLGSQQALAAFGDELAGAVGRSAPLLVLGALLADGLRGDLGLLAASRASRQRPSRTSRGGAGAARAPMVGCRAAAPQQAYQVIQPRSMGLPVW